MSKVTHIFGQYNSAYMLVVYFSFTWGSTRVVVGEGKNKKVLQNEEEAFDESSIPMKKFSGTSYAAAGTTTVH